MKVVCDCGNESELNTIDADTGEENVVCEDEGQYARLKPKTFTFWEEHDKVGVACDKCEKGVWLFT